MDFEQIIERFADHGTDYSHTVMPTVRGKPVVSINHGDGTGTSPAMDDDAITPGVYVVRQGNAMSIAVISVFVSTVVVDAAVTLSQDDDGTWEIDAGCTWSYMEHVGFRHHGPYSSDEDLDALKGMIVEMVTEAMAREIGGNTICHHENMQ